LSNVVEKGPGAELHKVKLKKVHGPRSTVYRNFFWKDSAAVFGKFTVNSSRFTAI
jgi:hypothetical protein